ADHGRSPHGSEAGSLSLISDSRVRVQVKRQESGPGVVGFHPGPARGHRRRPSVRRQPPRTRPGRPEPGHPPPSGPDGRNRGTRPGAARTAETGARPGAARLPGPPPGAAPRAPRRVAPPPPSPARPLVPPGPSFRPAARPCGRRTVRPSRAGQWTSGGRPPHGGRVTSAVLPPAVVRGPGVEGRRAPAPTTGRGPIGTGDMGRVTERRKVLRIRDGAVSSRPDTLVAEEPLELRLNGRPLAITMRTPGDDFALAAGFLVSEGVLAAASDLRNIVYCAGATADGVNTYNVVDVQTAPGLPVPEITLERNVYTTSSCGLCGKASLDAVRTTTRWPIADTPPLRMTPGLL